MLRAVYSQKSDRVFFLYFKVFWIHLITFDEDSPDQNSLFEYTTFPLQIVYSTTP